MLEFQNYHKICLYLIEALKTYIKFIKNLNGATKVI